ncbi:hypothetical protein V1227_16770 [Lentzea sp. DG1S-22]|uniref:hypothetical protein n=1 Tax=Lentzea sp. DG1S-22 TaxID=3108822 RepID=UPI002E7A6E7B|nr:hypothetical protein [Lentzea sp. DG1S-22]WVH84328.1 hypothetical protein V1227_16770 [Lentzea sp. DG1S-22]
MPFNSAELRPDEPSRPGVAGVLVADAEYGVEGFAVFENGMVTAHAWCIDHHGRVHDPTWPIGSGLAYLGIPFSNSYIQSFTDRVGDACLLHDAHRDNFRLLRSGLPPNAETLTMTTAESAPAGPCPLGHRCRAASSSHRRPMSTATPVEHACVRQVTRLHRD